MSDDYIQEILGKDIGRYINTTSESYFKYGKHVACYVNPKFFNGERILIREIVNSNIFATIVSKEFLNNPSIINVIKRSNDFSLKYILALINSKLFAWYHINTSPKAKKGLFPKILINDVRNLPIIKANLNQQQSLAQKAEKMIELNSRLYDETQKALELIELECKTKKITQKLEQFYILGLNPFIEELEKQGAKLTLAQKEDLITWYKTKSDLLSSIKAEIDRTDHEIDQEVYNLYGLTDEEIKIIEKSNC